MIELTFEPEQLEAWAEEANGNLIEFIVEFFQDMNAEVVYNTPVITGFLRGSWYSSIGDAASFEGAADPSGAGSVARMNATLAGIEIGDVYVAENGANYAAFVEYGTKHMAPRAFVGRAVDRAQEIGDAAAERVGARHA